MRYLILFLLVSFIGNSQVFYKGGTENTIFKENTGVLVFKSNTETITAPTCNDGIQNGDETGIDCGGLLCAPCNTADTTPPVIVVNGNPNVTITQGSPFFDSGATATDNVDGDITANIVATGFVDPNVIGNYVLMYNVSDAAGNQAAEQTRNVSVQAGGGGDPEFPWFSRNIPTPTYVYTNPTFTPPNITTTYTPTSAADLSNPANANKIAIISNSFVASNITLSSGQIIRPAGGIIIGANLDLNDAYIEPNLSQAFSANTTFSTVYDKSRVFPELFGAVANDSFDDIIPIEDAIRNVEFLSAEANGEYIINRDRHAGLFSPIRRFGGFDWNINNATIKTTDNSTFRQDPGVLTHQGYYLIALRDFDYVSIHNGEFDGQDLASRCIDIYDVDNFNFHDLTIRNYESPAFAIARAVAINFNLFPTINGFQRGFVTNCTIDNINAIGDGQSNNSDGISKGLNFSIRENGAADVFINNNTITNIIGDDGEGFYNRNDGNYNNATSELYFHIKDNDFINCQRRGIKYDASNAFIERNLVQSSPSVTTNQAAMIQVFSIQAGTPAKNVLIQDNNVRILGNGLNSFFGTNDSRDIVVRNNTFFADVLRAERNLTFSNVTGQQDNLYDGDLSNVEFTGNTITNGTITIFDKYYILPGLREIVFENNVQNFTGTINLGAFRGAINVNGFNTTVPQMRGEDDFLIKNHTINYDLSTMSSGVWNGVISSNGTEPKRLILDNVNVNYTGNGSVNAFFGGVRNGSIVDYDNTNQILNCTMTGKNGTGSLEFNGSNLSVIIQNSFGDSSTPLTFQ